MDVLFFIITDISSKKLDIIACIKGSTDYQGDEKESGFRTKVLGRESVEGIE